MASARAVKVFLEFDANEHRYRIPVKQHCVLGLNKKKSKKKKKRSKHFSSIVNTLIDYYVLWTRHDVIYNKPQTDISHNVFAASLIY